MFAFYRTNAERERAARALFVACVANLKPACSLALDDFSVQRAQFDLANVAARAVSLLSDQSRALQAAARSALRNVFAAVDANFCQSGIEVRLKHKRMMCLDAARFKARAV
jgi:hypothetical protein